MVEGNHWDQWFSDGFGVRQPLVTMVFDGCAPLVRRWNGYVPSSKSNLSSANKKVVACSYKVLWPKIDFLIFFLIFPWALSTWWPSEENAKKIIFFAEMACTHVGTKYIKRPWDFENFLEFWCTLIYMMVLAISCNTWGMKVSWEVVQYKYICKW